MAKYPDWMPNKKPYTAPPDPVVEETPAEEPIPQRTVYCNDCHVEMLFHSRSEIPLMSPGMFRALQEYLPLTVYECPQCGQYKFYKAPATEDTPTPRQQFLMYFKDYSKEQLQRIVEGDGHPDAVAVARELLEKKFGLY